MKLQKKRFKISNFWTSRADDFKFEVQIHLTEQFSGLVLYLNLVLYLVLICMPYIHQALSDLNKWLKKKERWKMIKAV